MRGEEGNQLDEVVGAEDRTQAGLLQRRLAKAQRMGITGLDGPLDFETKRLLAEEVTQAAAATAAC